MIFKKMVKQTIKENPVLHHQETNNLNGALQVASDQLKAFVEQMKLTANALEKSSYSSTDCVLDLKKHSEKTSDFSSQVSDKMRLIESSAVNISNFTESVHSDSQSSYEDLVFSWDSLNQLQKNMETLSKTHFILIDQMERLVNHSQRINDIVYSIGAISQKSRLLALNASIEAVRAGEYGKGFAVVAKEFETLSRQTTQAVEDTRQNIQLIQEEVTSTTNMVKEETTFVEMGSEQLNTVLTNIDSFKTKLGNINKMVSDSALAANEQTASLQEISALLNEISNMSINNNNHVSQVLTYLTEQEISIKDLLSISNSLISTSDELQGLVTSNHTESSHTSVDPLLIQKITKDLSQLTGITQIKQMIPEQHELLLRQYVLSNPELEAIWSNRANGSFIYSYPPAGIANATVRPWFREAVSGKTFVSNVYTSALTKHACISISLPIYKDNQVIGVIGVDLSLSDN